MNQLKQELKGLYNLKYRNDILKIFILFFLFFMIADSMDVFIPIYIKEHGIPAVVYGALETVTSVIRIGVIWVMAKPKMRMKKRILCLIFLINIVNMLVFLSDAVNISLYVFGMVIVTQTLFNITLNPYLARLIPNEYMGIVFGVRDVFLSLGCAAGLFISGFLSENPVMFAVYIVDMFCVALILLWRTDFINVAEIIQDGEWETAEDKAASLVQMPGKLKRNFFLLVLIGVFLLFGLEVHTYSAMIGTDIGIKTQTIYNLYSSSVLVMAVFSIGGGIIIDRVNAKVMYIFYTEICFLSVLVLLPHNTAGYAASLLIIGVKGVFDNVEQTYFFKTYKQFNMESLYSMNSVLQMILSFVSPILFGFLYDVSFRLMVYMGLVCLAGATAASFGVVDDKGSESAN